MQTVALGDLDDAALAAWQRLADRAAEPNPYYRPEFVRAAARAGDDSLVMYASEGGEWIACLPVGRASRWRRMRLRCLVPWAPDLAFAGTPLLHRDAADRGAAAFARYLGETTGIAALVIDPIDPDGPAGAALAREFARAGIVPTVYAEWERAALRRRPEPTYLQEAMAGKRRKELRRLRRALAAELGGEVEAVDCSTDPAAWDRFLTLEASSWKGEAGTALSYRPGGAMFFRAMCAAAASASRLQVLSLQAGGHTAAMQVNLVDGGTMFCFKVAYDATLARFSPGALLEADAIEIFHASLPADFADSCAPPDSELVNRMWPDRRRMQTLIVPSRARRAALVGPNIAAERIGRRLVGTARSQARARRSDPVGT